MAVCSKAFYLFLYLATWFMLIEQNLFFLLRIFITFLFKVSKLIFLKFSIHRAIVWKLARGYCLCYCKTFTLMPDSTECTIFFLPKRAVHYFYHLKSSNIIGQRKTTNTGKHFYPWFTLFNLTLFRMGFFGAAHGWGGLFGPPP